METKEQEEVVMSRIKLFNSSASRCTSLSQFLKCKNESEFTYKSLCYYEKASTDNIIKPVYNLLDDYMEYLDDYTIEVEIEDFNIDKYKFNPKKLSYDLYGTTTLYYILLYINNLNGIKEFNLEKKKIKIIRKDTLEQILSKIYDSEYTGINNYNDEALA